ncbi:MAG TPA: hypothetical protein VG326_14560 [Tepidisphaeraceae bacterium]|nr:hypothetical protein [Tepidisphaeraceae bacterium]
MKNHTSPFVTFHSSLNHFSPSTFNDLYVAGLLFTKGQMVAAEAELDGIAHRRSTNDLHLRAIAKTHFEQAPANFRITADGKNVPLAADAKLIEAACFSGSTMVTCGKITRFLHDKGSEIPLAADNISPQRRSTSR